VIEPELHFYWEDNNGRQSLQKFFLPAGETVLESVGRANALRDAARSLSSARLVRGELVYVDIVEPAGAAAPASDVGQNLVMLFAEGGVTGSVRLPSPAPSLPYDTSGPWASLRITRDALGGAGLLAALELAIAETVFPWGDLFPALFIVAGIDITI
jgi:hypothetical protein